MEKQQLKAIVGRYKNRLNEPVKTLYDVLGFDGLYELSSLYGGDRLYIPLQTSIFSNCLRQSLLDEFDGSNQRELSAKYGFCARTVYNIVTKDMWGKAK